MKKRVFRERYNNEKEVNKEIVEEFKKETKKAKKKVKDDTTSNK